MKIATIALSILCANTPSRGAPDTAPSRATLKGRVIGPDGKPIAGAGVTITAGWKVSPKLLPSPQPTTTTDSRGEFTVTIDNDAEAFDARIEAAGLATNVVLHLDPAKAPNELRLSQGAAVVGRMLMDGKPAGGVKVVLNRAYVFGHQGYNRFPILSLDTITDAQGRFTFEHVARPGDWTISAEDLGPHHAMNPSEVHVEGNNTVSDAGDLPILPAFTLSGKVILSDGQPMPAQSDVFVNHQRIVLDATGRFFVGGVLPAEVPLSVRVKGYRLSRDNRTLDPDGHSLRGTIDSDIADLTILLEPGETPPPTPMSRLTGDEKVKTPKLPRLEGVAPR